MNNAQRLKKLTNSGKTVFSLQGLRGLWQSTSASAKVTAKRMIEQDLIIKAAKGYYALDKNFNIHELANLIISPSYVSLNTALFYHGVAFQVSTLISSVALLNYKRKVGEKLLNYHSMKKELFLNLEGIDYKKNIAIASVERAVLDCFYFGLLPNLDNFDKINIAKLKKLSLFYPKVVQKQVKKVIGKNK